MLDLNLYINITLQKILSKYVNIKYKQENIYKRTNEYALMT